MMVVLDWTKTILTMPRINHAIKFNNLFGQKPRNPEKEKITQFHMDIAASIKK